MIVACAGHTQSAIDPTNMSPQLKPTQTLARRVGRRCRDGALVDWGGRGDSDDQAPVGTL